MKYQVTKTQARNHGRCTPQDYVLFAGTLSFGAGETSKNIPLEIRDDALQEGDEEIIITLSSPSNASLGQATHTATIIDNDRQRLVNVKDFGAKGDGLTDDSPAIQRAVDDLASKGGGVLLFPPGTYLIGDDKGDDNGVILKENITYFGYGAVLTRPPNMGKWQRTFAQGWTQSRNSKPYVIQGLTFDGNAMKQCSPAPGCYQNFSLEQAHLLALAWLGSGSGRTQAFVEDVKLQNGVGDGLSVGPNTDIKACHIVAENVFRGGFVMVGSHTNAYVFDLVTRGDRDPTGIDLEPEGARVVDFTLERARLEKGDFDFILKGNASVTIKDVISRGPHSTTMELGPNVRFDVSDSEIWSGFQIGDGGWRFFVNRWYQPSRVTFNHVDFVLTNEWLFHTSHRDGSQASSRIALATDWSPVLGPVSEGQLTCNNCAFRVDTEQNRFGNESLYAVGASANTTGNKISLNNASVAPEFTAMFHPTCTGCSHNKNGGDGTPPGRRQVNWGEVVSWFGVGDGSGAASGGGSAGTSGPGSCDLLTSAQSIPQGFGAAYNLFSAAKELLLNVECGATSNATLNVGNGQNTTYIYRLGYEWMDGQWKPISLGGANLVPGDWYVGNAAANLSRSQTQLTQDNFVIAYVCLWQGNSWKCGCRDQSCTTNHWQLQTFRK